MDDVERSVPDRRTFDLGPRAPWAWLTAGFAMLGLAETVALAALVHALLPRPVACMVDVLIVVPTLALLIAIASALTGRITVDADNLRLRFGLLGGALLPRSGINRAERYDPPGIRPMGLGIDVPAGSQQATVTLGGRVKFVRILLDHPVEVRLTFWRRANANEFVMGTGSPDQLIAALA